MDIHGLTNESLALRLHGVCNALPDDIADLVNEAAVRLLMWPVPVEQINEIRRREDWRAKPEPKAEGPVKRRRVRL